MNLKLAAALVAGTAAITMLAGCPQAGVPNVGEEAKPITYDAKALLAGLISGGGQTFSFENYTPYMEAKVPGGDRVASASIKTHAVKSNENQMYYEFTSGLTSGTKYQVIWDYKGPAVAKSQDVNTIQLFVTEPVTADAAASKPNVLPIDILWNVGMKPDFNATTSVPVKFEFKPITNLGAQYQVQVYDKSVSNNVEKYEIRWASQWMAANNTKVDWNGKQFSTEEKNANASTDAGKNEPTGASLNDGTYYYLIRFRKEGGSFGGNNFYGQTQRIPFKLEMPK